MYVGIEPGVVDLLRRGGDDGGDFEFKRHGRSFASTPSLVDRRSISHTALQKVAAASVAAKVRRISLANSPRIAVTISAMDSTSCLLVSEAKVRAMPAVCVGVLWLLYCHVRLGGSRIRHLND